MPIKHWIKAARGSLWLSSHAGQQRLRQGGLILMLHRIVDDPVEARMPHRNELCIAASTFDRFLGWLKRRFTVVDLETLLAAPADGKTPRVTLTFDDGWEDNARLALPILEKHGLPASIFLTTDLIGTTQGFWWESIGESLFQLLDMPEATPLKEQLHALTQRPARAGSHSPALHIPPVLLDAHGPAHIRSQALVHVLDQLKHLPNEELSALTALAPWFKRQTMSWNDVQRLEQSGLIRFGAHGASHALLDQLPESQMQDEVRRSLAALREQVNNPLPVYCYPNGNHSPQVREALHAAEIPWALGTAPGLLSSTPESPLALPRICMSQKLAERPSLLGWRVMKGTSR